MPRPSWTRAGCAACPPSTSRRAGSAAAPTWPGRSEPSAGYARASRRRRRCWRWSSSPRRTAPWRCAWRSTWRCCARRSPPRAHCAPAAGGRPRRRQGPQGLPRRRPGDALREAQVHRRRGTLPQARRGLRDARRPGPRRKRSRRRAPRQGGARPAVRRHRPRLAGRGVGIRMRDDRSALAPLRQRFERLFNASDSLPSRHVP